MSHTMNKPSIVKRFGYAAALALVPALALLFLGAGSVSFGGTGLSALAFAPQSTPKKVATAAKSPEKGDEAPPVQLTQWEYTGFRISSSK